MYICWGDEWVVVAAGLDVAAGHAGKCTCPRKKPGTDLAASVCTGAGWPVTDSVLDIVLSAHAGPKYVEVIPVRVHADIAPSDDLAGFVTSSAEIRDGDIVVVSQKAVSKQEGRVVDLSLVVPSDLAQGIASQYGKDPRIVDLVLSESARIVRMRSGVLIVETHSGIVCANAGVDESNVKMGYATLLPSDPDASARRIRSELLKTTGLDIPVIVSDTFGRPLRLGQTDCAIGVSGLDPISDYAGAHDVFGRLMRVTAIAVADEIASAAELVMQKTALCPAAIVRGCDTSHVRVQNTQDPTYGGSDRGARALLRPRRDDLFL